jgi:hypothetical protein
MAERAHEKARYTNRRNGWPAPTKTDSFLSEFSIWYRGMVVYDGGPPDFSRPT